jgi:hypothetical protein
MEWQKVLFLLVDNARVARLLGDSSNKDEVAARVDHSFKANEPWRRAWISETGANGTFLRCSTGTSRRRWRQSEITEQEQVAS